jgi:hypothetical protein
MDELVKLVAERAGISPQQAETAVQTVAKFLKEQAPPPLAGQIDALLKGGASPQDVAKTVGGLFGKK